ncbi:MAG: alcohol dehydrogenase catalytic domain-containing protein [Phycisphaeraceae bacterium]|nr:alcohol dehydrogenase catalytic domain-containing protein [Phycisphaeraceae bacterium]
MRRLLAHTSGWSLVESPDPIVRSREALVKITRALIDPRTLATRRESSRAFAPGCEFVGIVLSSPDSPSLEGKRVVAPSVFPCSACDLCRAGLSIHCRSRSELGSERDGAFAEKVSLPVASLVEIPKGLDEDRACFATVLGRAIHAADLVRLESKPFVTILGDDPIALLSAQVMTQRNASVRVLGREPSRFELCEKWGVKHRHIDQVGRRADQDVVFLCSNEPGDLEIAMKLARPRATVLLLEPPGAASAGSAAPSHASLNLLHTNEIALVGSRGERLTEALRLLAGDSVDVRSLLTAKFRVTQFLEAFSRASRPDCLRVVLEAA